VPSIEQAADVRSTDQPSPYPSGMLELLEDEGLSISQLFAVAWGLAVAAFVAWLVLLNRLGGQGSWNTGTGALAVAVTCSAFSAFSASCAVIVAIKSSEVRIRRELRRLGATPR